MRSTRPVLLLALILSSAALAQTHVRISYVMAQPEGATAQYIDRFSTRGANVDLSLELTYGFHFELSAGFNSFNAAKYGVLTTVDGTDVSGKQFRYLNAFPLMGGFAFFVPLGNGSRVWVGCNGGAAYFDRVIDLGLYQYTDSTWQWGIQPHAGIAVGIGGGAALFFDARYNYFWARQGSPVQQYWSFGVGVLFGGSSAPPKKH